MPDLAKKDLWLFACAAFLFEICAFLRASARRCVLRAEAEAESEEEESPFQYPRWQLTLAPAQEVPKDGKMAGSQRALATQSPRATA